MLIIVESPAKAKTIGRILGSKAQVVASIGHVRQLSDQHKTPDGRKLEISGIDIANGFVPIYEIQPGKKAVIAEIQKLAKKAKGQILFATDSDREGEAISWHLTELLGITDKTQVQRLEFHEITPKAILQALEQPRPLNLKLVEAQQARQVLDKLVGYKLSPVLWAILGSYQLSAGRVQSPALRLLCEREHQIQNFVSQEYWEIKGQFQNHPLDQPTEHWVSTNDVETTSKTPTNKSHSPATSSPKEQQLFRLVKVAGQKLPDSITSRQQLQQILGTLPEISLYQISNLVQKTEHNRTHPPFITSTLQQAAANRLGYSPKLTMQLAQRLYEGVEVDGVPTALITYMRTDSVHLSEEAIAAARQFITQNFPKYLPTEPKHYQSKSRNAQEAHEAIRPTDPMRTPASLYGKINPRQWKLYELIWQQTIACQMTDEIRQRVVISLQNHRQDEFIGSMAWTTHLGFKALTEPELKEQTDGHDLPTVGTKMYLHHLFYYQKFTQPPSRYSASSLIKKLEELGIGRPSTYATIISTLQERKYIQNDHQTLIPTTLGLKVDEILTSNFTAVTSAEMTAKMEEDLDAISRGQNDYKTVLSNFWWDFKQLVESKFAHLKSEKDKYRSTQTDVICPTYGDKLVLKMGRFGEYYQNPNHPECIYPKNFREYAAALEQARAEYGHLAAGLKCQVCDQNLVVRISKKTLKPYIACPQYQVGNNHTVLAIKDLQTRQPASNPKFHETDTSDQSPGQATNIARSTD